VERSLGAQYFDELAVMVDTFQPLELGEGGRASEDPTYAWSWAGRGGAALTDAPVPDPPGAPG
jgi:homogentisate 1,2-dioxygenase